jgi:hypothetical protein
VNDLTSARTFISFGELLAVLHVCSESKGKQATLCNRFKIIAEITTWFEAKMPQPFAA